MFAVVGKVSPCGLCTSLCIKNGSMLSNDRKYYSFKVEGKERLCAVQGSMVESNRYSALDPNYVLGYLYS